MRLPSLRPRTWFIVGLVAVLVVSPAAGALVNIALAPGDGAPQTGETTRVSNTGLEVDVHGSTNFSVNETFPSDRRINVYTTAGNISLAADADATNASVHTTNITGTWTNVTEIQAGGNWVEVYPETKARTDVRGDIDQLSLLNRSYTDDAPDLWVEGTDGGTATVKVYDAPAGKWVAAVNESGVAVARAKADANGNATFNVPLSSQTLTLSAVGEEPPVLSNNQPTGLISDTPNEIAVDVNDPEFADGDEVRVKIYLDGSQIHSENITSNQTVTTSNYGTLDLGDHTYNVSAEDVGGNLDTLNASFSLPANVTLRNESNASQVITGINFTATAFSEDGTTVVRKTDSNQDGNISLRGLPDTEYVITIDGQGEWYDRRVYLSSIGDQSNIYLLNSTAYPTGSDDAIETTFVYEDRTDQFPQDNTTLEIQRAVDVNDDDTFAWETVAGDFWGAAGEFPFTGQYQTRYRLVITNRNTGESRVLGTHIPTEDGIKNVIVGRIIFDAENSTGRYFDAALNQSTDNIQILYQDPTDGTTDLNITVYEQGNKSNVIYTDTFAGPVGQKIVLVSLTGNQTESSWVVEYDATHDDDGPIFGQVPVGGGEFPLPIESDILATMVYIMTTFIMLLYGPRTATIGAWAGVLVLGGFTFFGWVSPPSLFFPALIAVGVTLYAEGTV
jgi:hypothetical protein